MAQPSRVTRPIENNQSYALAGNIHGKATAENDEGPVSPSLALSYVTVTLAQTDSQRTALDQLLAEQQTPGSPNYHRWLTPEEYADRFGASQSDLNAISSWLQGFGLKIAAVAKGRSWIAVNGSAAQVEAAFKTELHHYLVNGEMHFANATEPSVPTALRGVVTGIHGLNDFRMKPSNHVPKDNSAQPLYNSGSGNHYLAPDDVATIYNIKPLYDSGINGTGQKIVVAGQTQINLSDIQQFRKSYNLPANDPQVMLIPNSTDPGISSDDLPEADLDLEWAGAAARNATILYVYAFDVMSAVQYAIDQNLAPVVSTSYGSCELETSVSDAQAFRAWARQGNAQGITWFSASGDSGAADCNDSQNSGLAVDLPSSVPEVTSVGGTEFAEGSGQYWSATNDGNLSSALSYIPETTWNDSITDGTPSAGGGGASVLFTKPSWQTGPGVPADNARHTPDVSLSASANHDGYLVYTGGALHVYGGTSVPTPVFAGIAALLNHYLTANAKSGPGLGNINPGLYSLAQSSSNVFHDITTGDNIVTVPCSRRNRNCLTGPVGFSAGSGYDQATGLGSVDVYHLVTQWTGGGTGGGSRTSLTVLPNVNQLATTDVMYVTATVSGSNGVTPTGMVTFSAGSLTLGQAPLVGSAGNATATLVVNGSQLPLGTGTITASYTDSSSNNATDSVGVSVTSSASSSGTPVITALGNGASFQQAFAPGGILSVFGTDFSPSTQIVSTIPLPITTAGVAVLINGVIAPLYYASQTQLNIQIPYETPPNNTAVLSVNNNGRVATHSFSVGAAAPGIFTDQNGVIVPVSSGSRGQAIFFYITGMGAVSPPISNGAAPSSSSALSDLPRPTQNVTVSIGGAPATIDFKGITPGLVGVMQINVQVPNGIPTGAQKVIVSIGGIPSQAATVNIVN